MSDLKWKTAITKIEPNKILLRGYPIEELMGRISFSETIYLALRGDLPSKEQGRVLDAILVSSIDHGSTPPSALTAMTVASTGAPLNAAVASGVLAISQFHGGAIEGCMEILFEAKSHIDAGKTIEEAADLIVSDYRITKRRVLGFGHRIHSKDPRTERLFEIATEAGLSGDFMAIALAIKKSLKESTGKNLPLNVDGAIAAVLCEMGFYTTLANAFFIMARVAGLVAHVAEEQERQKPMRKIHPTDHEYDGPAERHLKMEGE